MSLFPEPEARPPLTQECLSLISQLERCILESKATATFACGGSIRIASAEEIAKEMKNSIYSRPDCPSPPVTIRWDTEWPNVGCKLVLPIEPTTEHNLEQLLKNCQPATFGLMGQDVLDEQYRKASKLDTAGFCSDFNPYDHGIIDTIAQVLLPSVSRSQCNGVRAELYKLNVYAGPSGMFKAHVDTPRGEMQFGSLVVCLPCAFTGGALLVRHQGRETRYDWASSDPTSIKWAAFYSDCEHEILEVTAGHRITLTYNLFATLGCNSRAGTPSPLDPTTLPLHAIARDVLTSPAFMPERGVLAIPCVHAYAHTSAALNQALPRPLKGVDMAVYECFRALGLSVQLKSVVGSTRWEAAESWEREEQGLEDDRRDADDSDGSDEEDGAARAGATVFLYGDPKLSLREYGVLETDEVADTALRRWRRVDGAHMMGRRGVDALLFANAEPAVAYAAYGNCAETEVRYSFLAILVEIPGASERGLMALAR